MNKVAVASIVLLACGPGLARADNAACWGDNSRSDITCVQLTEKLLLSLRGQTIAAVQKAMKAPGADRQANGLHFLSNYSKGTSPGTGDLNVLFDEGRAVVVNASVDTPSKAGAFDFVWSAYQAPAFGDEIDKSTKDFKRQPYCSDFSGMLEVCRGRDTQGELSLSQMQFNMGKGEMLQMLEGSCHIEGIRVEDPHGDCERLKRKLQ